MPLPPVNHDVHNVNVAPVQPNPAGPENPVAPQLPEVPVNPPAVQPDPAVNHALVNGAGPDLQPGAGQAVNFAANHGVGAGRDWDMHSADGMLEMVRNSVSHLKEQVGGAKKINEFVGSVIEMTARMIHGRADVDHAAVAADLAALRETAAALKNARAALVSGISEGGVQDDPRAALAGLRKTLRAFRFETQVALGKLGHEAGRMELYEGSLREIQNFFTFGVGHHVEDSDLAEIARLESELVNRLVSLRGHLAAVDPGAVQTNLPQAMLFGSAIGDALELSHRTNDQIRDFQDADAAASKIRGIVEPILKDGGGRSVEFTVGAGALIGLGFSKALTAGVRPGARVRLVGEFGCEGPGRPLTVTFRWSLGAEAKAMAEIGEGKFAGVQAEGKVGGTFSHFTTRTYPTLDDFLLDADRCKLATTRTLGDVVWGGIKAIGGAVGKLGTTFFRWLGRRSGEVKQDNAAYLQSLQARNVVSSLDGLLAKRANPVISSVRTGRTLSIAASSSASASLVEGVADISASGSASLETETRVQGRSYAPLARLARNAKSTVALDAMMRPGPGGGRAAPVPHYNGANQTVVTNLLEEEYRQALLDAEQAERNSRGLHFTDTTGFARAANRIRTILLATELAVREGRIPRAVGDRLLARFSNPSVKFPPAIFREYLMDGTGAAKPAKTRGSISASFSVSLFTDWSKGLTKNIANPFLKAVAESGVGEMRRQSGLDTTVAYSFSSEMPASPGADPRPWENTVKTCHALVISASTPARFILDAVIDTIANNGERIQDRKPTLSVIGNSVLQSGKDVLKVSPRDALLGTIPGLILAGVKESAKAAVRKWLDDPEKVLQLAEFIQEHADEAFDRVIDSVEWAANHPDATLHILAGVAGASSLGDSSRNKVLSWSFVDGKLDLIALDYEKSSTMGVNVDPVGVGLGLGFDVSYTVTETTYGNGTRPNPPLATILSVGEEFLLSETGLGPAGGGEAFKNWLAGNAAGIERRIAEMCRPANLPATLKLVQGAMLAADGDTELQMRLQDAWRALLTLPANAALDAKIDAMHAFAVPLILAYRTGT